MNKILERYERKSNFREQGKHVNNIAELFDVGYKAEMLHSCKPSGWEETIRLRAWRWKDPPNCSRQNNSYALVNTTFQLDATMKNSLGNLMPKCHMMLCWTPPAHWNPIMQLSQEYTKNRYIWVEGIIRYIPRKSISRRWIHYYFTGKDKR